MVNRSPAAGGSSGMGGGAASCSAKSKSFGLFSKFRPARNCRSHNETFEGTSVAAVNSERRMSASKPQIVTRSIIWFPPILIVLDDPALDLFEKWRKWRVRID